MNNPTAVPADLLTEELASMKTLLDKIAALAYERGRMDTLAAVLKMMEAAP